MVAILKEMITILHKKNVKGNKFILFQNSASQKNDSLNVCSNKPEI